MSTQQASNRLHRSQVDGQGDSARKEEFEFAEAISYGGDLRRGSLSYLNIKIIFFYVMQTKAAHEQ